MWMCIDNHHVGRVMHRVSRSIVSQNWLLGYLAVEGLTLLSTTPVQTVLSAGVFVLFGMSHLLAGLFTCFLLPETRGIPLEQVWLSSLHDAVLRQHSSVSAAWLHQCCVEMESMISLSWHVN